MILPACEVQVLKANFCPRQSHHIADAAETLIGDGQKGVGVGLWAIWPLTTSYSGASEYRLCQLVNLLLAALGLAEVPGPRARRVSGFEVLATAENQQQKNKDGKDFHCSPPKTRRFSIQALARVPLS
jgi:hypothetical protein